MVSGSGPVTVRKTVNRYYDVKRYEAPYTPNVSPNIRPADRIAYVQNITDTPEHYQPSHWVNVLSTRIDELSRTTPLGHPIKIAVAGIPGSGKTELAKYYVWNKHRELDVVWNIISGTRETLWRDYLLLAEKLKLENFNKRPGEDPSHWENRVCLAVNGKLREQTKKWVLVFDNVKQQQDILEFIPKDGEQDGIVIITTQYEYFLDSLHTINISEGMEPKDAVQLLNKITLRYDDDGCYDLVRTLEYLPLYILVAAATIRNTVIRDPENKDFQCYKSYCAHLKRLSASEVDRQQRPHAKEFDYGKTQHVVIRDAINRLSPDAKCVIIFCCYISSTGIKRRLLENFIGKTSENLPINSITEACNKILDEIQQSCLLRQTPGYSEYNIHNITQQVGQEEKLSLMMFQTMLETIIAPFENLQDITSAEAYKLYGNILPHLISLVGHETLFNNMPMELQCSVLHRMGIMYYVREQPAESHRWFTLARTRKEAYYGLDHKQVAATLNGLAMSCWALRKIFEAKELFETILNMKNVFCGDDAWKRAITLNGRAIVDWAIGNVEAAKVAFEEVLRLKEEHYGPDAYQIGITLNGLAFTYRSLGMLEAAKSLEMLEAAKAHLERAVTIMRNSYRGSEYWQVSRTLNNLAIVYRELGDHTHSLKLIKEALDMIVEVHGPDHLQVAITYGNIAFSIADSGDINEAKRYYSKCIDILRNHYGEEREPVFKQLLELTENYWLSTTLESKTKIYEKILLISVQNFGELTFLFRDHKDCIMI